MASLRFRIKRPSDDGFHGEFRAYHRCKQAKDANDVLTFWPYAAGQGMPLDAWWASESEDPCPACHRYVMAWFQWSGALYL